MRKKLIVVKVEAGTVQEVLGIPLDYRCEVRDYDIQGAKDHNVHSDSHGRRYLKYEFLGVILPREDVGE